MTKISSKTAYPKKKPISSDYFVGTDSEDFNKTINFGFEEVAGLVNDLNGTPILNYVFSTSPYLSTEVLLEGRFLSDENELSTPSLTKLYINKFNNSGDNLQELYLFLQTNATDFYLKLRNSNNQNNAVYFDIASIEDFPDYFILNITVFKENEFLPLLENLNVYFFDFELKATSAGTSDPLKLDKDGYTGTAKDIDDRIIVLENLQDLNTNFTGQAFAVWTGEGYVYDVIYPDYYIQGVLYPGATQQITLEASDAVYSRFDVIYVNASGAQKATGDPALNPLMPTIDEGIDLFVTSELVVALSTAPVDSSIEQVYNENIEWTTSSLGSLVNFNATNRPSKGIKNADIVNAPTAMFTQFTTPTTKNISDFNTLKFDLFFVENYGKTHGINVYFLNGSTIIGSYVIKSGLNNYKFGNFGAYQSIVVDFSSFTFTGVSFDTIKIVFPWANAGFSIDNVVLVKGSSVISPTQKAITTIVTDSGVANATISDDTFTLKGGNGASVSAVGKVITITPVNQTKSQVGLGNVDNTSDANKPVSTLQQAALDLKVDKVAGKGLSTEDYTTSEKNKLASIDATHYLAPLQTTVQLSALPQAGISDKARVYVENDLSDYFYDATAVSGDIAPDDQVGGIGFWRKVAVGGETAVSIMTKYESNADRNAFTNALKSKLDSITEIFTTALKTNYDSAYAWISTNGAAVLAHISSAHAPSNAQKNSDITKAEIEAKLTGEITTHTHPAVGTSSSVVITVKEMLSTEILTHDVAGIVQYINALSVVLSVASNEIVDFYITNTNQIFRLKLRGRSFGVGEPAISDSNVYMIKDIDWDGLFPIKYYYQSTYSSFLSIGAHPIGIVGTIVYGQEYLRYNTRVSTSATAGSSAYIKEANTTYLITNRGFIYLAKIIKPSLSASPSSRGFFGLGQHAGSIGNINPSTYTGNFIGFGFDSLDTNLSLMYRLDSVVTKTDLGVNFPKTDKMDMLLKMYRFKNTNIMICEITNLSNGVTYSVNVNYFTSGSAPSVAISNHINNGTDAVAVSFSVEYLIMKQSN